MVPNQDFNRFVPIIIKGCLKNNNFPCSSGIQQRDFLYIDDAIDSILKCIQAKNIKGEIFNIGSGKPKKIKKDCNYLINKKIKLGKPLFGKIMMRKDEINNLSRN
jgi:nucleoside-diphosphate-sugar epimerase